MKPIYRVIKHKLYEKCNLKNEYFTIQKQVNNLSFKWWITVKATISHHEHDSTETLTFNSEAEAIKAINNLQNGSIPEGWVSEVSTVIDFNKEK